MMKGLQSLTFCNDHVRQIYESDRWYFSDKFLNFGFVLSVLNAGSSPYVQGNGLNVEFEVVILFVNE
jgi:hypothetical protein